RRRLRYLSAFPTRRSSDLSGAESGSAPSIQTNPTVRWTLTSSFPSTLDTIYGSCDVLAERVAAMSEGRFTIRVFEPGEIVPALQDRKSTRLNSSHVKISYA